jgi:hypothetical protein
MHLRETHTVIHPATLRPRDWLRFVEIDPFPDQWSRLDLSFTDSQTLQILIMSSPREGITVRDTGGLRRGVFTHFDSTRSDSTWSSWHSSFSTSITIPCQSGLDSYCVDYVFIPAYDVVLLWGITTNGHEIDFSRSERVAIREQVRRVKHTLQRVNQ